MHRVGTHVADQADRAFVAERGAFVQFLRHAHRARSREAEFARGFLLKGRGDERRRRPALAFLAADVGHVQGIAGGRDQALAGGFGRFAVGEGELFELLAVELDQARGEGLLRMRELGFDAPVLAGDEGFDLLLALDDHAQRRRLHAAGRQAALHLAPKHRRQAEADEVVERAARLLRIDQVGGDLARMRDRFLDRARGDLGEHDAIERLARQQAAFFQDLGDVPADRLAFAVRVGRKEDGVGRLGGAGDGLDVLLVLLDQLVAHGEVALGVDRAFLRHQVAHVAVGGQDGEVLSEVLVDRLGLGGGLDDKQVLGHSGNAPQLR